MMRHQCVAAVTLAVLVLAASCWARPLATTGNCFSWKIVGPLRVEVTVPGSGKGCLSLALRDYVWYGCGCTIW
jgi:hypothetical protein